MTHTRNQCLLHAVIAVVLVLTGFPFIIMLMLAAKDPAQIYARFWHWPSPIRWENFLFGLASTSKYILNSLIVSGTVCIATVVIAMPAAYAFSVMKFPGRKTLFIGIISLMMVPGILMLVPLFLVVRDLGLLNSYGGLILPQVAGSLVLAIFLFRSFFDDIPRDLFEAAHIDGAQDRQILAHIVFPLSAPIVSTVAVVNVLASWNNYVWPLLIVRDESLRTIPLGLAFLETEYNLGFEPGKMMAALAVAAIPMIVVFLLAMKSFMKGMTSGAVKG